MNEKFANVTSHDSVKRLVKMIMSSDRYREIDVPLSIEKNYFVSNNYALFLLMDSLFKFVLIIDDVTYLDSYMEDLEIIFKRMHNYHDINKGINTLLSKYSAKILGITNMKSLDSKEKIFRYVYKKYIVDGYFYYGFNSSCYKMFLQYGIQKNGFVIDSRLDDVNMILKKYEGEDVFRKIPSSITDSFVVASYFAFIGPDYLERIATSLIFDDEGYDKSCFYQKDINKFRDNFILYAKKHHMSGREERVVVNNFLDVFFEDQLINSRPLVALVKRSLLGRHYLKDVEEVVKELKNMNVNEAISMILESRYTSFDIGQDIPFQQLELIEFPSYKSLMGEVFPHKDLEVLDVFSDVQTLKIPANDLDDEYIVPSQEMNSYGFATIFMFLGLIFLSLGVVLSIILSLGG